VEIHENDIFYVFILTPFTLNGSLVLVISSSTVFAAFLNLLTLVGYLWTVALSL
jgi:hypothetical protein